jgi:hypothetical protein
VSEGGINVKKEDDEADEKEDEGYVKEPVKGVP